MGYLMWLSFSGCLLLMDRPTREIGDSGSSFECVYEYDCLDEDQTCHHGNCVDTCSTCGVYACNESPYRDSCWVYCYGGDDYCIEGYHCNAEYHCVAD